MEHFGFLLLVLITTILLVSASAMMPGGITDTEVPVTKEIQTDVLDPVEVDVLTRVRSMVNGPVDNVEGISYKSQIVAGVNYFVKYRINNSHTFVHARIYKDLSRNVKLVSVSGLKTEADPITYFK